MPSTRPGERPPLSNGTVHASPTTYPLPFPPLTAQPPVQIPFSDPFHTTRDPFLPGPHARRDSLGSGARAWPSSQDNGGKAHHQQYSSPPHRSSSQTHPLPPPPPAGLGQMSLPYDPSRRRSLGGAGSPPQYMGGPLEPPPHPPSFAARNMPPPSPPQLPPSHAASSLPGSAPRGPPITSPFTGARDLASMSSHRPGAGMSILSILGGGDERKTHSSPGLATVAPSPTPKSTRAPSPGRARSLSMREAVRRRDQSPVRGGVFGESRATSALYDRAPEPRRDGGYDSPQLHRESPHSFRAFRPELQEPHTSLNGIGALGRPNSQPAEPAVPHTVEEILRRPIPGDDRLITFRNYGEPRSDALLRNEGQPFPNGVTSQPRDRDVFGSPRMDRDGRHGPFRFQVGSFGTPMREDQAGLFRPAFQHGPDAARESVEARALHELRREAPRSSPPVSDWASFEHNRNGYIDRPMTLEEHQRLEALHREQQRKESDGSSHRALLNISPEFGRRGRNSPLPQAVQGAQPRPVGPGGDNPGIKTEFSRMFSGLGSGVGSTTPTASQSINGNTTPSRMSPTRHIEDGDLVRTAVAGIEDGRNGIKAEGKKHGRRPQDDMDNIDADGRTTPEFQRENKRAKSTHPPHHHHHRVPPHHHHHRHHHESVEPQPGPFNMLRFPSNPGLSRPPHHHHHHLTHAHPQHHHHHTPRAGSAPRKPTTTVLSKRLIEEVAGNPRKHLGSQLYTTVLSLPSASDASFDAKIKFNSEMNAIPYFEGRENCTYTVRVPRWYMVGSQVGLRQSDEPSPLEEIGKRRQLWGTDVYTDDSDVVAAAVHSGWLKGDFGELNGDLEEICDGEIGGDDADDEELPLTLTSPPPRPVRAPPDLDVHITVLILPPLDAYASTTQHHIRSRAWEKTHDGMSFMIHRVDFVDEGESGRFMERTIAARKQRMVVEEQKRKEAAAGLLMFAANGIHGSPVRVGA